MGKAGRIACIFTPYALSVAALVTLVLVGLGSTKKGNGTLEKYYFFKANLHNFTADSKLDLLPGTKIDNDLLTQGLEQAKKDLNLKDIYTIGLWNYCDGDLNGNNIKYDFCSPRKAYFWFNPVNVWGLNNTGVENLFPKGLRDGLNVYEKVSKWMFVAYAIAFFATILELLVGISAIFSRWGSFATTIISSISTLFYLAFAITSTALYAALAGSFNSVLKVYGIHGSLGRSMYAAIWIGAAFSIGSGIFWLFSVCCCSGRSPYSHRDREGRGRGRVRAEKTPYTYERVGSPYLGNPSRENLTGPPPQNVPLQPMNKDSRAGAYEPFRHEQVP